MQFYTFFIKKSVQKTKGEQIEYFNNIIKFINDNKDTILTIITIVGSIGGIILFWFKIKDRQMHKLDFDIDLSAKNGNKLGYNKKEDNNYSIKYEVKTSQKHIQVQPHFIYFDLIKKDKEVPSIDFYNTFSSTTPSIDIKLTNNEKTTLRIDKIDFIIEYSQPIVKPMPMFTYMSGGNPFEIIIRNYGWSKMYNSSLEFYFKSPINNKKLFEKRKKLVGEIDHNKAVNFSDIFSEELNFDIDYLNSQTVLDNLSSKMSNMFTDLFSNDKEEVLSNDNTEKDSFMGEPIDAAKTPEEFHKKLFNAYGKLKNKLVDENGLPFKFLIVHGKLKYQYSNHKGGFKDGHIYFKCPMRLYRKTAAGLPVTTENTYDILLKDEGYNYKETIENVYTIKAGESENIRVSFDSIRYSKHKIKVIAKTNKGKITLSDSLLLEILKLRVQQNGVKTL